MYIDSQIGASLTSFLSTATGWGNVGFENGEPLIDAKYGEIPIQHLVKSDEQIQ
jgi:hypothetical protein